MREVREMMERNKERLQKEEAMMNGELNHLGFVIQNFETIIISKALAYYY